MGEAQIRTTYDAILAFSVVVPINGTWVSIWAQLSTAQQAEINTVTSSGFFVCGVIITPQAAILWQHATPGTVVSPSTPGTRSPNGIGFPIAINQKPNEVIPMVNGHLGIFLTAAVGATTANIGILCVSRDTL